MDCVLFASPVHIVTAWPIAPQKQGYNIVWGRGGLPNNYALLSIYSFLDLKAITKVGQASAK